SDLPEPVPGPGEALVRVRLAGICRTDLEICRGYLGFEGTPGHEWVGELVAAPDPGLAGARVGGESHFACRRCAACRAGLPRPVPARGVQGIMRADGAFAELLAVPARVLHRVPEDLPDDTAVFAEPVAAAFEILEQLGDVGGRRAVVLGDGKLGLLVAQVLGNAGARVTLAGRHAEKLALARRLGIDTRAPQPDADLVRDATGSAGRRAAGLALGGPRGTVVLKTTIAAEHRVALARAVVNEVTVLGSRCGPFAPALAALAAGAVQVEPLVEAVHPLAEGIEAFARAGRPGALKVLIAPAG